MKFSLLYDLPKQFSSSVNRTDTKYSGKYGVKLTYPQRYFAADFETTVYEGQTDTEVWAASCAEIFTKNEARVYHSIDELYDYFCSLNCDVVAYFHNLKFDGSFWLCWLLGTRKLKQAYRELSDDGFEVEWIPDRDMACNTFKYSISSDGQWYSIRIKQYVKGRNNPIFIEFRDSLKLIPFSLRTVAKAFNTEHKKLDMVYEGYRYSGCEITEEEMEYIKNDVYVLREALEFMFEKGERKLTIGSCCLDEFKHTIDSKDYANWFPDLTKIELPDESYDAKNADDYVRNSYRGGWCYLVKGKENKVYGSVDRTDIVGTTADVNSLYPSMMHSKSGNVFPVGKPQFWKGEIPERIKNNPRGKYYFVRIKTKFRLKEGMLPTIQIKGSFMYSGTEMLVTSDYVDKFGVAHSKLIENIDGKDVVTEIKPVLTLTMYDYQTMLEHYDLFDTEYLDGCWFNALDAYFLFDDYMDKWIKEKAESKGANRTLAKLFLNNLYGKMATSPVGDFKIAKLKEDGSLQFNNIRNAEKLSGYIPIGSAITSYSRCFTIKAAQANYHGTKQRGFIYADTDSIHCDLKPEELRGIRIHETDLCSWKLESCWNSAIFVRAKTYIEHITHENQVRLTEPKYEIKCAGMPDSCKKQFVYSMTQDIPIEWWESADEVKRDFVSQKRTLKDFKVGLKIHGKLMPKQIKGGVILEETEFEMRAKTWGV